MDDLSDLLKHKKIQKPVEVTALVEWCQQHYPSFTVSAQKRTRDYLLTVPNAPLAQEIHMRMTELKEAAQLDPQARVTIRIA